MAKGHAIFATDTTFSHVKGMLGKGLALNKGVRGASPNRTGVQSMCLLEQSHGAAMSKLALQLERG